MKILIPFVLLFTMSCAGSKIALLIGNSQYEHIDVLSSPSKDIPDLAKKLRGMGFEVIEKYDLDRRSMKKTMKAFKEKLLKNRGAIALFYYSGHGSQAYGESYLIPIDVDTRNESDIEIDAIKVENIAKRMASANTKANILFLDACRNVPTGTMGGVKGLGQVNNRPSGSLIVYSTSKGNTAKDNRIFNKVVLSKIDFYIPLATLANAISYTVDKKTEGEQVPEVFLKSLPEILIAKTEESSLHFKVIFDFYTAACNDNDAYACYALGILYDTGRGVKKDAPYAKTLYAKACDDNVANACMNLGVAYLNGRGVERNLDLSTVLFEKACLANDIRGCSNLGNNYYLGRGTKIDHDNAKNAWGKACVLGDQYSCDNVKKLSKIKTKKTECKNGMECYNLGVKYSQGKGVKKDSAKSKKFYMKSCDFNYTEGCFQLGSTYDRESKHFKALKAYEKSCNMGSTDACYNVGIYYNLGKGVKQDNVNAIKYYDKACNNKKSFACYNIGVLYRKGAGVGQDTLKGIDYYKKSCQYGDKEGCFQLGSIYTNGKDVKKNIDLAIKFYSQSCKLGEKDACRNLKGLKK